MLQSTLAEPCGCNRETSNKRRTYSVLRLQQTSRQMSLQQQQQLHCRQQTIQLKRHRNISEDSQKQSLPDTEQHKTTKSQTEQVHQQCNREDEEQELSLIDRRLHCKTVESSCNSYPMYAYAPRGSSNSSLTTLTTSLGKISLNEGNNNCRSESTLAVSDETTARHGALAGNGHCKKQLKLGFVVINDSNTKTSDLKSKAVEDKNNITSQGRRKLKCDSNCVGPRSSSGITAITNKLKSTPRGAAIGVLAKKLRSLPLPSNTKSIFITQHKMEEQHGNEAPNNRLSSHVSVDSAKSTISNSSLQDVDETEFIGSELAHYMGELNQQRLVR